MEQRKSTREGPSGVPSTTTTPLAWMHRPAPYPPDRRAKMLEHMARARSVPQPQAAPPQATAPRRMNVWDTLRDAYGYAVLSAIIAFFFRSPVPFYFGAFMFLTDGERIESALAMIGIRFEPGAVGPDIVKGFVSLFGWFVLLVALRDHLPTWLVPWMPPGDPPWSIVAGFAFAFIVFEAVTVRAMRCVLPWFGLEVSARSLTWSAIKVVLIMGVLVLLRSL